MSDLQQRGPITTLPRLASQDGARRDDDIRDLARSIPVSPIIPSLVTEMDQPALVGPVAELVRVQYLDSVVITLGRSGEKDCWRPKDT
jgi:hypothetical protein